MVKTTGNYSPKDIDVIHAAEADIVTREMITDPVHLMQYDKRFQILEVKLWKSGEEYAIPANTVVSIRYQKPDHTYVYNPALGVSQDRKIAYFEVSQEMTTVHGTAVFIVEIVTTDDKTLGSARIDALIDRNPVQEDGVESSSEFKTLVGYVTDAENSMRAAKTSETNAKASEVAAKDSETKAKTSETNAKASEVAAKDSETKAKTSETNAKASEVAALASQNAAKVSEDNALASERKAKTSEQNAKTSEINSANSKNAAATSATEAASSAHDAAQSAAEALASQNAAKISETKALTSETNAKKSETNAGTSAAAALVSQNAAKTSETKAATSETNAKASEVAAKDSETKAKTSETNAKASEVAAKDSEENALSSEQAADTYKTQAATSAEEAADSAAAALASQNAAKVSEEKVLEVESQLAGTLVMQGTVAFENLPSLSAVKNGWMYNVSNEFTTTAQFKEGAGHTIAAGSNVYKTADGFWDVLAGNFVSKVNGQTGNVDVNLGNIEGVLSISKGGTGKNNATDAFDALASAARHNDDAYNFDDTDKILWMYHGNKIPFTQAYMTSFLKLWNYIKSKLSANAVTGVKGNKETNYRVGQVNLTAENVGAVPWYNSTIVGASTDWDTITDVGSHKVQNATMNADHHAPVNMYPFGTLLVFWAENNIYEARKVHIYIPHATDVNYYKATIAVRTYNGSAAWADWYYISDVSKNDATYVKKTGDQMSKSLSVLGDVIVQKNTGGLVVRNADNTKQVNLGFDLEGIVRGLWDKTLGGFFAYLDAQNKFNINTKLVANAQAEFKRSTGQGQYLGTAGTSGWVVFAEIKIKTAYINNTLEFVVGGRGRIVPTHLCILFNSVDHADPGLANFYCYGETNANNIFRIKKTATSTWQIAAQKNEAYGSIYVIEVHSEREFVDGSIGITYPNIMLSTAPDSTWIAPTFGGNIGYAAASGSANSLSNFILTSTAAIPEGNENWGGIGYTKVDAGTFGPGTNNIVDGALYKQRYSNLWEVRIYQDYRTGRLAVKAKNNGIWQATKLIPIMDLAENMQIQGTFTADRINSAVDYIVKCIKEPTNSMQIPSNYIWNNTDTEQMVGTTSNQSKSISLASLASTLSAVVNNMKMLAYMCWGNKTKTLTDSSAVSNLTSYKNYDLLSIHATSTSGIGYGIYDIYKNLWDNIVVVSNVINEIRGCKRSYTTLASVWADKTGLLDRNPSKFLTFGITNPSDKPSTLGSGYVFGLAFNHKDANKSIMLIFHEFGDMWIHAERGNSWYALYSTPSSIRFKNNVRDLEMEEVNKLLKLRPVIFDYKEEYGGTTDQLGLIAEEVDQIFPSAIVRDPEGNINSIKYQMFISPLIKMTQVHEKRLTEQDEEIQELKAENAVLKAELAELRAAVQMLLSK